MQKLISELQVGYLIHHMAAVCYDWNERTRFEVAYCYFTEIFFNTVQLFAFFIFHWWVLWEICCLVIYNLVPWQMEFIQTEIDKILWHSANQTVNISICWSNSNNFILKLMILNLCLFKGLYITAKQVKKKCAILKSWLCYFFKDAVIL